MRDVSNWVIANGWAYSATMNLILALTAAGFGVTLTKGAGFHCPAAMVRLGQRLGFLFLAGALMNCALQTIVTQHTPPLYALLAQIGFIWVLTLSAAQHFWWAPPIPDKASWTRPMRTFSYPGPPSRGKEVQLVPGL